VEHDKYPVNKNEKDEQRKRRTENCRFFFSFSSSFSSSLRGHPLLSRPLILPIDLRHDGKIKITRAIVDINMHHQFIGKKRKTNNPDFTIDGIVDIHVYPDKLL
jgi:hypothetical protein